MQIDWNVIVEYLPDLLTGARVTLAMTGLALLVGIVVGLALALARISGIRIISWPAYAYIEFFRTTPPLVQIVWFYFMLPVLIGCLWSAAVGAQDDQSLLQMPQNSAFGMPLGQGLDFVHGAEPLGDSRFRLRALNVDHVLIDSTASYVLPLIQFFRMRERRLRHG